MELKIYITLFILGYILNYFFGTRGHLACGIWAYCGASPPDPNKLTLLALYNLKRGEHATGYYADGIINKATKPVNAFLAENYKEIQGLKDIKNFVVIGHDRQASIGYRDNLEQAHPHGIKQDDRYKLVLVHNGTLTNYHAMADHYKIPTQGNSDSQILTQILGTVEEGEVGKVLRQYEGTATVVFTLPKYKHKLFVHRDPDRDLFFFQQAPDQMYISSIKESLQAIGGTEETIFEFRKFEIASVSKGKIVKTWSTAAREPISFYKKQHTPWKGDTRQLSFTEKASKNSFFQHHDIVKPKEVGNGLVYKDGYYYMNGHRYTGVSYINSYTNEWCKEHLDQFQKYWFVRGIIMINEAAYNSLISQCMDNNAFSIVKFEKFPLVKTCEYSLYPILGGVHITQGTLFYPGKHHRKLYGIEGTKNMSFIPLLSNTVYRINGVGLLISKDEIRDSPEPSERKIVKEGKDLLKSIEFCLNNSTHTDFNDLYAAVRYSAKEEDSPAFFKKVMEGLLYICTSLDIVSRDWVEGLNSSSEVVEKRQQDDLNTLLELYYTHSEDEIENFQSNNPWLENNQFLETFEMVTYVNLQDFFVDFIEDDKEVNTKPFLMAIAHELARRGIITTSIAKQYESNCSNDIFRALEKDYEVYVTVSDKKSNCCISDSTPLIAEIYKKLDLMNAVPGHNLTEDEQTEYAELKARLKTLMKGKVNKEALKIKYDLTITQIEEIYE